MARRIEVIGISVSHAATERAEERRAISERRLAPLPEVAPPPARTQQTFAVLPALAGEVVLNRLDAEGMRQALIRAQERS